MEEYGVEEIEAINIINGGNSYDCIAKYERIRTQTPLILKTQSKGNPDTEN